MNKIIRKKRPLLTLLLLTLGGVCAQAQIVSYNFNQGSGPATNAGTAGSSADLTINSPGAYSANGGGVSGQSGDYAFVGVGSNNSSASTSGDVSGLDSLSAMTITAWVSTASWVGDSNNGHTIVSYTATYGSGFGQLRAYTGGELFFKSNTFGNYVSSSGGAFDDSPLEFIAMTWTGTSLNFYLGTTSSSATLVSTIAGPTGITSSSNASPLVVGNTSPTGIFYQAFNGTIDNVQIYNTALGGSAIESIRVSALSIPEPSSVALLGLAAGAVVTVARRRRAVA